ncbi:GNAT family N-acetyltransferase [Kaistella carnis]|uniref:N-acetyltransferase family protein n=1 Tax=Kaistella carnis TaxID=1241979 RepID=A0A3G8XVH5_9FLAO|nr:GNAT family N-acetyltransferase [Kaistella carnis]AZI32701.1 N-acetyltransferase family protein [Kaistella carnis]
MNYEIRPMQTEDADKVLEIFQQGINGGNATFDKVAPTWEAWDTKHFNLCRFVLEDENDQVVGWCALQPVSNRDCFKGVAEVSIYLDGSVQGKGLGTILLKKLILDSEEHDFWTLQAGIFPENKVSIAIHQKQGFRTVGTREKIGELNGQWRDIVLLERRSKNVGI